MSKWKYQGQDIGELPPDAIGFVYLVTHRKSGRRYIGQKTLYRRVRRKPLKGRKRHRIDYVESDWKTYNTSCREIQEMVRKQGVKAFKWEILYFCARKSDMNYFETRELFSRNALFDREFFNKIINCRISCNQLGVSK